LQPLAEIRSLLGKKVCVTLNTDGIAKLVVEGQFLGFGQGGDFEILAEDGYVHYCWPLLNIEEVK
jgi:hypothetical protein